MSSTNPTLRCLPVALGLDIIIDHYGLSIERGNPSTPVRIIVFDDIVCIAGEPLKPEFDQCVWFWNTLRDKTRPPEMFPTSHKLSGNHKR